MKWFTSNEMIVMICQYLIQIQEKSGSMKLIFKSACFYMRAQLSSLDEKLCAFEKVRVWKVMQIQPRCTSMKDVQDLAAFLALNGSENCV